MIIHLSPTVRADVVYGTSLAFRPWWHLRENLLFCDPSKTDEERQQHTGYAQLFTLTSYDPFADPPEVLAHNSSSLDPCDLGYEAPHDENDTACLVPG